MCYNIYENWKASNLLTDEQKKELALISEDKKEIECPECKNIIELDWSGDLGEDNECSGHCHGCSCCDESDEDDDM